MPKKRKLDYAEGLEKAGRLITAQAAQLRRLGIPEEKAKELWLKATELIGEMFRVEREIDTRPVDAETLRRECL